MQRGSGKQVMVSQSSFPRPRSSPFDDQEDRTLSPAPASGNSCGKSSEKKFLTAGDRSLIYMGHINIGERNVEKYTSRANLLR